MPTSSKVPNKIIKIKPPVRYIFPNDPFYNIKPKNKCTDCDTIVSKYNKQKRCYSCQRKLGISITEI